MTDRYEDVARHWVSAPGGSCDVRYGADVVETMGKILASNVGRPPPTPLVVHCRRSL